MTDPLLDPDTGLTSLEVAEQAGLGYQRLHRWCAAGAIKPSIADADGTGTRRRWNTQDANCLTDIATVAEDFALLHMDMSVELVARLWDMLQDDPDSDVAELLHGSITVTVDRRERRHVQARRLDVLARRTSGG